MSLKRVMKRAHKSYIIPPLNPAHTLAGHATVLGDRLETGTHPESQPHETCAAQSQRAHANGTANKFPIKAVPLRLHTI